MNGKWVHFRLASYLVSREDEYFVDEKAKEAEPELKQCLQKNEVF